MRYRARTLMHWPRHKSAVPIHQQVPNSAAFFGGQLFLRFRFGATCSTRAPCRRAVVAALDVRMVLVARDQKVRMTACDGIRRFAARRKSDASDLSTIINEKPE